MTAHAACSHPNTPAYRESCRHAERLKAAALRHGLEIVEVHPREPRDDAYCHIWQFRIKNPRRSWPDTEILVTCSRGVPTTSVCSFADPPEKVSFRRAFVWMSVIAI